MLLSPHNWGLIIAVICLAVSTMNNEKVKEYMLPQITPTPTQFSASSQYGLVESTSSHSTPNHLPELTVKFHKGRWLELGPYQIMKFLPEEKDAAQMSSLLQLRAVIIWYKHFCAKNVQYFTVIYNSVCCPRS